MLQDCFSLIKNGKDEIKVLASLKRKLNAGTALEIPQNELRANTTLIIEAVKKGYIKVVIYLHQNNLCSIDEENYAKQTPLMVACLEGKENIAQYLAKHSQNISGDTVQKNPMHYLAKVNFETATKLFHARFPQLIHLYDRTGETPVFIASKHGNLSFVKLCLQEKVSINMPDVTGMTPFAAAFINGYLEVMELLLSAGAQVYLGNLELQRDLFETFVGLNPTRKIACLMTLLSAGGGLALSHIPDSTLEILKVKRAQLTECLIGGEQKREGIFKTAITSGVDYLNNTENWRFKTAYLARACMHPSVIDLPQTIKLKTLLDKKHPSQAIAPIVIPASYQPTLLSASSILALSLQQLVDVFSTEMNLLDRFNAQITSKLMRFTILLLSKAKPRVPYVELEFENYFFSIESIISVAIHPFSNNVGSSKVSAFEAAFLNFNEFFRMFLVLFDSIDSEFSLKYLPMMENKLRILIKQYGSALKEKHQSFYNSLVDAHVHCCQLLARQQLNNHELDVALNLSIHALQQTDKLIINNDSLNKNVSFLKARCFTTMAEVFHRHGWKAKASRHLRKAFEYNEKEGLQYDPLLISLSEELATLFVTQGKYLRCFQLLTDAKAALEKVGEDFITGEVIAKKTIIDEKLGQAQDEIFTQRVKIINEYTHDFAQVECDKLNKTICLDITADESETNTIFAKFLKENPTVKLNGNRFVFEKDNLFAQCFIEQIRELAKIFKAYQHEQQNALDALLNELNALQLSYHQSKPSDEKIVASPSAQTFGFEPLVGFKPIVPLYLSSLPKNTLFMTTMDDESFEPFSKLIDSPPVKIIPNGPNQQGVKLCTKTTSEGLQIAYARLKIKGADGQWRAQGRVEQTIIGEDGKIKKLYVFRTACKKKKEINNDYKVSK